MKVASLDQVAMPAQRGSWRSSSVSYRSPGSLPDYPHRSPALDETPQVHYSDLRSVVIRGHGPHVKLPRENALAQRKSYSADPPPSPDGRDDTPQRLHRNLHAPLPPGQSCSTSPLPEPTWGGPGTRFLEPTIQE